MEKHFQEIDLLTRACMYILVCVMFSNITFDQENAEMCIILTVQEE